MARVQLKNVEKTFNKNKVLKGINVEVPDGSFMVMVGPSRLRASPRPCAARRA